MAVIGRVGAVLVGRTAPLGGGGLASAIAKLPVAGPVWVSSLGLAGDEQADRRVHGGIDKAVHAYAASHYATWRAELGEAAVPWQAGAFGENLSVEGVDEQGVCLGDLWRVGRAELRVSQGRQPCFKLNRRFGVADMAARVQDSLRAGWYLRVERPGAVQAGDAIERLARPHPAASVAALLALIRDRSCDPARLAAVLALPLPPSWQRLFAQRLARGEAEDWARRLRGSG